MFTKSFTSRVLLSFASVIVLASSCMAVTDGGDAAPTGIDNEKRSWNNLQGSWGKRRDDTVYTDRDAAIALNDLLDAMRYGDEEDEYSRPLGQKRAWKNMNGAWGKRVDNWNKFRGAWGKREPGWNNLKGLWGKRDNWNKLQSAWGKRSSESTENF